MHTWDDGVYGGHLLKRRACYQRRDIIPRTVILGRGRHAAK